MTATRAQRVVIATRPTTFELVLARHATVGQARFFLAQRGRSLDLLRERHEEQERAVLEAEAATPTAWRRARVSRAELDRFLFEPDDLVVAIGQDGLVANVAKYLDGQPVFGVNPSPGAYDGILVPLPPEAIGDLLATAAAGRARTQDRTMVEARLDDGQRLVALNEVFVGHPTHQSARYLLRAPEGEERQSSSGVVVATGTGATGWARSIHRERRSSLALPAPEDRAIAWFVREAFPSVATGVGLTEGRLGADVALEVVGEMDDGGVVFGDGIEADRLLLSWGQRITVRCADRVLRLVRG